MRRQRQFRAALVDSHVHLDVAAFDADRSDVIARARAAEVGSMVIPSILRRDWPRVRDTAATERRLHAAFGIHPCFLDEHEQEDIAELAAWLGREVAVAIGECGLDYRPDYKAGRERQQFFFGAQLALAREFSLPVIVHAVKAVGDAMRLVRESGVSRGVFHSFGGSAEEARQLVELGFHIGVGGVVTRKNARRLRETVATVPLESLLLETDAPWQPPGNDWSARNEPARIREVLAAIAAIREEPERRIAAATTRNAKALFALG
ncbi:MAG: DNAase [Gammaproteobacteria bacterium]|nr:MAG: DNAase [Gammaproteobacteria bacterium]PIE37791.1 MAG: DNAase [Gammaproteobacteria bacterium]